MQGGRVIPPAPQYTFRADQNKSVDVMIEVKAAS